MPAHCTGLGKALLAFSPPGGPPTPPPDQPVMDRAATA
nr:IclR family transcriptional regulator C-terminal domain-containing protein [Pseudonocardia kunmingensis]